MTLENKLSKLKNDWNITKQRFINSYPRSKFNKNDRIQILSNIAYCQWHIHEIELGLPWNHLTRNI